MEQQKKKVLLTLEALADDIPNSPCCKLQLIGVEHIGTVRCYANVSEADDSHELVVDVVFHFFPSPDADMQDIHFRLPDYLARDWIPSCDVEIAPGRLNWYFTAPEVGSPRWLDIGLVAISELLTRIGTVALECSSAECDIMLAASGYRCSMTFTPDSEEGQRLQKIFLLQTSDEE